MAITVFTSFLAFLRAFSAKRTAKIETEAE